MICQTCLISQPLSLCEGKYTIGQLNPDTEVMVRIKNVATGKIDYVNATTDSDGKVEIEYIPMEHQYEIQVINATDGTPYAFDTTLGVTTECIKVHFEISHNTEIKE